MRRKLLIRVDGSKNLGHGHMVRCLALAQILTNKFDITFYCREIPGKIKKEVSQKGFKLNVINNDKDFLKNLTSDKIVVLDGHHFDSEYQREINKIGCNLICIDDLYDREFYADLIINHSQGVYESDYQAQPYTEFALGLEYALLRSSFLDQAKQNRDITNIEKVFICCGGSDPKNFTEKIVNVIREFREIKKVIVVTGEGYSFTERIQEIAKKDSRIEHQIAVNEEKMRDLMLHADLAIVPTSSILLEAMCCSCNILTFWYGKDQRTFHNYLVSNHYAESFGDNSRNFKRKNLRKSLKKILKIQSESNYDELLLKLANVENNLNEKIKSILEKNY